MTILPEKKFFQRVFQKAKGSIEDFKNLKDITPPHVLIKFIVDLCMFIEATRSLIDSNEGLRNIIEPYIYLQKNRDHHTFT